MSRKKVAPKKYNKRKLYKYGLFVGRCNPVHNGHECIIRVMLSLCIMSASLIGSANTEQTLRQFFAIKERVRFMRILFPNETILPLNDYPTDEEWLRRIEKILRRLDMDPRETVLFTGSDEDAAAMRKAGWRIYIVNRFDGKKTPPISASEVRDALRHGRSLARLLNPKVARAVRRRWDYKWPLFKEAHPEEI